MGAPWERGGVWVAWPCPEKLPVGQDGQDATKQAPARRRNPASSWLTGEATMWPSLSCEQRRTALPRQ
eukprot:9987988-Alexandrium_andersonii.AAC.1